MRIRLIILVLFGLVGLDFHAQDINYIKEQASILADGSMKGRGYVDNGLMKAARHISEEFDRVGLKPFVSDYFQAFEHQVNTFPRKACVSVNGDPLIPGEDFILDPSCPSIRGSYTAKLVTGERLEELSSPDEFKKDCPECLLVLEMSEIVDKEVLMKGRSISQMFSSSVPVAWVGSGGLVWGVSSRQSAQPIIEVLPGRIDDGAKVKLKIDSKLQSRFSSQNVIGFVEGTQHPDSFIVFTAHYDHLGMMGKKACFFGANDNASGTAYVMSLAQYYLDNPSKYSVAFMAFAGEEAGLVGSQHYVQNPLFPLEKIKFLINLDLMGSGVEGITVVNAKENKAQVDLIMEINEEYELLPLIKKRGQSANSDHYHFAESGVPAVFIYAMGGSKAYHDIYDIKENLTFEEYPDIFRLLTSLVEQL